MQLNWTILLLATIIPMIIGFIWYHPSVFGTIWMRASSVTPESAKGANMALIFGLSFFFAFLIAFTMQFVVIHQFHVYSILVNEPGLDDPTSEVGIYLKGFMDKYGNNFRTFRHGVIHGVVIGIFFALPITATNALFERKGGKYIFVNAGYWIISLALMGGVICAFA
jgi:hypothetical protein